MDSCYIHSKHVHRQTQNIWKLLHLSDFVNNFMILQLFLALEHNNKQNISLRFFSFVANSLKQILKIKNKELLCTKVCTAFCSIVTASL